MVTVDRITENAKLITPGVAGRALLGLFLALSRLLLACVGGALYGSGWLVARAVRLVWAVAVWSVAAVRLGWSEGFARELAR